jgi:hypothetical protein
MILALLQRTIEVADAPETFNMLDFHRKRERRVGLPARFFDLLLLGQGSSEVGLCSAAVLSAIRPESVDRLG